MRIEKRFSLFVLGALLSLAAAGTLPAQNAARHAISFDDLIRMNRLGSPQISPDGKWIAYVVTMPDMEANRNASNIWLIAASDPQTKPIQLTRSGRDTSPVWSPDGKSLAFLSSRSGEAQAFLLSLDGGEPRPLTHLSGGVDIVKWSPDGNFLVLTSAVYPACKDDACNAARDAENEKNKVKAHVADHLLYRHWTHWNEGKRSHLFVMPASGSASPRDLTAGADYDVPPDERGGPADIAFSPDSRELCFVAVTDKVEAISTNGDLFTVPVSGGEPRRITSGPGFDGGPAYSPDGQYIAYRSQQRPGYESDLWRLMLFDRRSAEHTRLIPNFDRSVEELLWSPDSSTMYFAAESETIVPVFAAPVRGGAAVPKKIIPEGLNSAVNLSRDGNTLIFLRSSLTLPAEIFSAGSDGSGVRQLTRHNEAILATLDMNAPETFWFDGAAGAKVQAILVRPPNFDPARKYPLLVILHGGPQTMAANSWGYRWNPQVFSGAGYASLLINRRGSTGYGQKFTDEITNDWGGKAYEDVVKGVDAALAKYPFLNGSRMAAAGGSYGGYMANWIATHNGRFKAIISHAGIFDKASMYATEELWFEEHDMQGTPWGNPESYRKWAPLTYAAELGKYKTPTLVIAGERDYRVPYTQSLEFFSALQRQEVPSRLVVFPDEGHWILKPQNSRFWYKTFFDWLAMYVK